MRIQIALLAGAVVLGGTVAAAEINKAPANNPTPIASSASSTPIQTSMTTPPVTTLKAVTPTRSKSSISHPQQPNQINGGGDDGFRGGEHEGDDRD